MFGLLMRQIRWVIARSPAMTGGVEMVEIKNAGGKALERRLEDPAAISFVVTRARSRRARCRASKRSARPVVPHSASR